MQFSYKFHTVLINFSRQEHLKDFLQGSFNAWDSQVLYFTPFHLSFTVPINLFVQALFVPLRKSESANHFLFLYIYIYAHVT